MECVEAVALKSSRKEMMVVVKQSPPQLNFLDEFNCMQNGAVSSDDFFVDELLDFSNEDGFGGGGVVAGQRGEEDHVEEQEEEVKTPRAASVSASVSPNHEITLEDQNNNHHRVTTNSVGKDDFVMIPATELCVPADDVASLEWLSHFVEDSNSEYSTPFPVGALPGGLKKEDRSEPGKQVLSTEPCFKTPVPGKARSKRTRTGVRVWPLLGSPSLTESSSSPTASSSSSSCPSSPWLIYTNTGPNLEPVDPEKPVFKKQKKTQVGVEVGHGGGTQTPRRCSHCGVQKTPQWRTGPLGAKTLCNACGVRYKSGRLLPEYRPACSPTFSSELHSNHHRKVLEMRKKKEPVFGQPEPVLGQGAAVPSFG